MQADGNLNNNELNNEMLENCKNLMIWTHELCIQKQRDSCLTSNFSLLLTIDENIDFFLGEFQKQHPSIRKLFELMTEADININIIYEALLCIWNISSNKKYFYFFENRDSKYIEKIVQVIRTNKIDKVARIGLMLLKNLLDSQTCVEILFDIKFMQTVSILLTNKWNDPIIKELLNYCFDYLEKNYKSMK
jgi:V-type H+-transporting ATPase subunit H